MTRIAQALHDFVLQIGGPGLFVIAFLDSSFLSLPQINDLLVIYMVTLHKERMVYYAAMATAGSVSGCIVLYTLARKGGEAFIRRRFSEERLERALALFQRYGVLAVAVPAILPPPAPFKLFILLSGVAQVRFMPFVLAVAGGRGFRYFGEGFLAVRYGDQALEILNTHGRTVSMAVALTVLMGGIAYFVWRSRRSQEVPGTDA